MHRTIRHDPSHARRGHHGIHLTRHARRRMQGRGFAASAIDAAIEYGRAIFTRGAIIHAIGRNEIARWAESGIDLSGYDGVQVVCSRDGTVLTVYRNRNFRLLRTGLGRGRYNRLARSQRLHM